MMRACLAQVKATLWCLWHWGQMIYVERSDPDDRGRVTFVGACTGGIATGNLRIHKTFYHCEMPYLWQ